MAQDFDVNTIGVFLCCRAVAPHCGRARYGRIINLTSGTAFKGAPFIMHYVASKGAVMSMTRSLARDSARTRSPSTRDSPGFTIGQGNLEDPAILERRNAPSTGPAARSRGTNMRKTWSEASRSWQATMPDSSPARSSPSTAARFIIEQRRGIPGGFEDGQGATTTARKREAALPRRELNKQEKLRRIKLAARELFLKRGYDDATMREIAKRAEVGLGTLFSYASDKRDLLFLIYNDEQDALTRLAFEGDDRADSFLNETIAAFEFFYRFFSKQPEFMRFVLRELTFYTGGGRRSDFRRGASRSLPGSIICFAAPGNAARSSPGRRARRSRNCCSPSPSGRPPWRWLMPESRRHGGA